MREFATYLRRHLWQLVLLAAALAVFAGVFYLYRMPPEAVFYAALLTALPGALLFLAGFLRYVHRHRRLRYLLEQGVWTPDQLPSCRDLTEEDYQQMLEDLSIRLRRAQGALEEAQTEMRDYYTLWAHQIKTPLAARDLILQVEGGDRAGELRAQLLQTEQYVEMVLAFVRSTADTTDFLIRRCVLEDLVRQSVRRLAPLFIRKDIRLELEDLSAEVVTDEKWLCFVLEQVLSNALKYTPRGGTITISARGMALTVRDTGAGIAPEDLPRVWEKGYTGRNGRADKRSTGIGLYLCRKVLSRLGHTISIASHPGEGTAVTIDLTTREITPIA